eukprot:1583411-Rhodomonas_salina.1
MKSLAASAHLFEPGAVMFTLDIGKAYVVSKYMGCSHHWTERVRADGTRYIQLGCDGEDCCLACSKYLMGFRWRGQYFAFSSPMFSWRVSGILLDRDTAGTVRSVGAGAGHPLHPLGRRLRVRGPAST